MCAVNNTCTHPHRIPTPHPRIYTVAICADCAAIQQGSMAVLPIHSHDSCLEEARLSRCCIHWQLHPCRVLRGICNGKVKGKESTYCRSVVGTHDWTATYKLCSCGALCLLAWCHTENFVMPMAGHACSSQPFNDMPWHAIKLIYTLVMP